MAPTSLRRKLGSLAVALLCALALGACRARQADAAVTVRLDPSVRYQTIRGWSCNPYYLGIAPRLRDQVVAEAVDSLGLTRLRWQASCGSRAGDPSWEPLNDDGDPDHIDWSRFATPHADRQIETWVVPFKKRVEANGEPFELWFSPSFFDGGSTGTVPAWILQSPGEYAEYVIAYFTHMKEKYGIEPTHYVICNEAGNNNAFQPPVVIEFTKALGPRLKALGFKARGQFSDGVNAGVTWRYIQAAKDDPEFWPWVDVLSYHWYGGNNQTFMPQIRDFARDKGIDTGQTEFMNLTMNHLYEDLTLGGVSYWCIYGLGGPGTGGQNFHFSLANTSFTRGAQFWNFRQVMHYARPGAVRIEASADDAGVRPLAFVRNGRTTLVLINDTPPQLARQVTVTLPAGDYGVCQSVAGRVYQEMGVRKVAGETTLDLPANSVVTLYPYAGANLPPTITDWQSRPEWLARPASNATLTASAQDPEQDALTYKWGVAEQPAGANVTIAAPDAATTGVSGLSAEGLYVFSLAVSDGKNTEKREVMLRVFEGNQPPVPNDVHNRIPIMVTLPQSTTILRGGGFDLEGDKLTFKWSIVSQPAGAQATLETPKPGETQLAGLTVPGDYVLEFTASDATHTVPARHTVTVYPANNAPVVQAAAAEPATIAPSPGAKVTLTATTSDPDGDTLTHWWRVRSAPAGANVTFSKQGGAKTEVTGLTVAGTYAFSITVADRSKFAVGNVLVSVGAPPAEGLSDPPAPVRGTAGIVARGATTGAVTAKGPNWVEVRSESGRTARYMPRWSGGMPADGGGPEKRIMDAIAALKVGDQVRVQWHVDDHIRIEEIGPAQ